MALLERALEVAPDRVMATLLPAFAGDLEDSDVDALLELFPDAPERMVNHA
jgi:hypothetical protein